MPKKKYRYCIVDGCLTTTYRKPIEEGISFFKLPSNVDRCREWLILIGRQDLLKKDNFKRFSYEVCMYYFEESDIVRKEIRLLLPRALPKKLLPNPSQEGASTSQPDENAVSNSSVEETTSASIETQTAHISTGTQTSKKSSGTKKRKHKLKPDKSKSKSKQRRIGDEIKKEVTT